MRVLRAAGVLALLLAIAVGVGASVLGGGDVFLRESSARQGLPQSLAPAPPSAFGQSMDTTTTSTTTTEPPPVTTTAPPITQPRPAPTVAPRMDFPVSLEPCGGDLPPCWVKWAESRGDYGAINPTGCGGRGCFGAWQFSGEWAGRLGLPLDLRTATPQQQDDAARALWNGGRGCANWAACG